jgi:hypothetical protein
MSIQANGNSIQICNATTGYCVQNIAFCDTSERAMTIVKVVDALRELKQAVEYTPLGVRGIKAVEHAKTILAKIEGL